MGMMYYKRFRMELDLRKLVVPKWDLPTGYSLVSWQQELVWDHAEVKYYSFRTESDANVFPCLGDRQGCLSLMSEIVRKDSFLPGATWLARYDTSSSRKWEYCGTIQGIQESGVGSIQNLGVIPEHRNRRLGTFLLLKSLVAFRDHGLRRAQLEVTARNAGAIRLYESVGFSKLCTVYKTVEVSYA